ncbi:lipopolysaccharide transport periplasmic protein LptA [Phaeobacter sp. HS012]|nr:MULTISPECIES: LptA/OstA family protein [Phaeobacter]APX17676.1 lipopolysaccharide transport periplasmic protein LptA [Phaeobacter inhibens]KXF88930.1 lipopolysaccharide transport periplasmic protein LptA [Phaeobacter inhibens]MBQ4807819.1 lipopolysaccharide transport periplasmic protein LptA [Phaeobacter sp. HS012]MBQ4882402.1 lipopolysaccharide transport periplasmic protein LptA [Phaeobacter sp. HS011]UWR47004.1 lipopolysaccharide transport periplasmic protein LptA [Phaeobacter inhibens]
MFCLPVALFSTGLSAQSASIAFGAVKADPSQPVEVTAETLDVNQADGSARFIGDVVIIQGVMRLSANDVLVIYKQDETGKTGVERLEASGNVILVNGPDAAEADKAEYTIDSGTVVMTGNVLLSQSTGTLTSNRLVVDLTTGTASLSGRVKTILNGGSD